MAKPLSPKAHGIIDYLSVPLLLAAGPLAGFDGRPSQITSTVAGAVLVYSAFTAYPPGLVKLIPLAMHRAIDVVVALMFLVSPWALGFSAEPGARWFFPVYGALVLVVVSLTDFTPARPAGQGT